MKNGRRTGTWRAASVLLLMVLVLLFVGGCGLLGPTDNAVRLAEAQSAGPVAQAGAQAASAQAYAHAEAMAAENNKATLLAWYALLAQDPGAAVKATGWHFDVASALIGAVALVVGLYVLAKMSDRG